MQQSKIMKVPNVLSQNRTVLILLSILIFALGVMCGLLSVSLSFAQIKIAAQEEMMSKMQERIDKLAGEKK